MQSQRTAQTSTRTPAILALLALLAGLAAPLTGEAALIVTDLNVPVPVNTRYYLDLNQDSVNDYSIYFYDGESVGAYVEGFSSPDRISRLSPTSDFLTMLSAGAQVDATWFNGTNGYENLYYGRLFLDADGLWGAVGAHGYIGLRLANGNGTYNYGWLEVTHGSLTLGRVGYQTTVDAGAEVPADVPVPGTLALLVSGAVGLGALRRRQRALAAA